jgi:hypothetical protein
MYSMQENCSERTGRQSIHPQVDPPLVTTGQHVVWENAAWRVECNDVHNRETLANQRAVRISPASESHYEAIVVSLATDGQLHLLSRYRYPIERWSLEFPRFDFENGDDGWKEAAEVDLFRLAGLTADKMTLLGAVQADPTVLNSIVVVILAEGCRVDSTSRSSTFLDDGSEGVDKPEPLVAGTLALPLLELIEHIHRGEISCCVTLAALTLYRAMFR